MKSIFRWITSISLRFRVITIITSLIFAILGITAISQLKQELIPPIEFPQTIILSQVSGMTSEEVLAVITSRLEEAIVRVEDVINLDSTTTGAFGSVITARNEFGINQQRIQGEIQDAVETVWFPMRRIVPAEGQIPADFAKSLLADLSPDVLIYLTENEPNFVFQLNHEVWAALSPDTSEGVLAYLAQKTRQNSSTRSALQNLVEQEIVPQLEEIDIVANVSINGGQSLPDEENVALSNPTTETQAASLLLDLSSEVWVAATAGLSELGPLNEQAVAALKDVAVEIPEAAPSLPESWQSPHFSTADDLAEMSTFTRNLASVFNDFAATGEIVGSLGQTDDLTPETVSQMLELAPSMVEYFEAEHLAAMSDDVFAVLPDAFVAGLDGFTRDALAAGALAVSITGRDVAPEPVQLPSAWRIQPPQLITFSFDDLPLASFSVFTNGSEIAVVASDPPDSEDNEGQSPESITETPDENHATANIPEGPALPPVFALLGGQFGAQIDTADDLINLALPPELAAQFGAETLPAADFFNFLMLLRDPSALPEGAEMPALPFDIGVLINFISPDAISFLIEYDPTFLPQLSPEVYELFSDGVLAIPAAAPPLPDVWNTLASQAEFSEISLETAADVLALGEGQASAVINSINNSVPERFGGYEVRLLDSLTPATMRYFALQEPGFYQRLSLDVLLKLSPSTLELLTDDFLNTLGTEDAALLKAIAAGEEPSAAVALAELYATDVPPADPDAPALNAAWEQVAVFYNIELNSADDFFRYPEDFFFPTTADFINSFFGSAQGAAFAPNLLGGLSIEAATYMLERDPLVFNGLIPEAIRLLQEDVLALLPAAVQERAATDVEIFEPTNAITRTNGYTSLDLTVYKTSEANTVEAFHIVDDALKAINEENNNIDIAVAFEQSSFIEESISGVAREGGLGAVFAVIVILAFLSSGVWARSPRQISGIVITIGALAVLALVVWAGLSAADGDIGLAYQQTDIILRFMLIAGAVAGIAILLLPRSLPRPAWRSTLVTAVSIPLSLLMAMAFMRWVPPYVHELLAPSAEGSDLLTFIIRLFPESITLNIMTLSGLTVAIGRVVDDSIVVLENIFRQIQEGGDRREAIITGTRDVSVAIFAATAITVVVFLPLGLTGGIIGAFFLPFGLAVTYALSASFIVAITVVPLMAYLFISEEEAMEESEEGLLTRIYMPVLNWALKTGRNRAVVLVLAALSMAIGVVLFASRPAAFLPDFGEPQITVNVELPAGTGILETNALVAQMEAAVPGIIPEDVLGNVLTTVGSGGASIEALLGTGGGVSENIAAVTIGFHGKADLDKLARDIRTEAESIFGQENVSVSAGSISSQGFGAFALEVSGPPEDLAAVDAQVVEALNNIDGIANVTSNLAQVGGPSDNGPTTYIRVDQKSAVRYTGELETDNSIGVTQEALAAIEALPDLPDTLSVSQGFESELQTQGFSSLFVAMGIAVVIVIGLLIVTFGSLVHWMDIMLSVIVAPVGAAVALTLTDRVLGISAMIGMLMLIGIVVTNAVVLIDRVMANRRERKMSVHDALVEAGERRLRPIMMTALATIFALIPLAIGLSEGAIIASELGTVVIGGLFSSTLLTLIVVPVAYSLLNPLHERVSSIFKRK